MKKIILKTILLFITVAVIFAAEKPSKLNKAVMDKKVKTVKALIEKGADVNETYGNIYPLERACDDLELTKILIEAGAQGKEKAFRSAAWETYDDVVKYYCENNLIEPNDYASSFENYLTEEDKTTEEKCQRIKAITMGKLNSPLLLTYVNPTDYDFITDYFTINLNEKDKKFNDSIFHRIAKSPDKNSVSLIEYLLAKGVDINSLNTNEQTALFYAITVFGPSINWNDPIQENEAEAKINFVGDMPYYSNPRGLQQAQVAVVMSLLQNKININQQDKAGWSVLHYACAAYPKGLRELLISNGADENLKTLMGRTPFDILSMRK